LYAFLGTSNADSVHQPSYQMGQKKSRLGDQSVTIYINEINWLKNIGIQNFSGIEFSSFG
jgi:hypothetical protein